MPHHEVVGVRVGQGILRRELLNELDRVLLSSALAEGPRGDVCGDLIGGKAAAGHEVEHIVRAGERGVVCGGAGPLEKRVIGETVGAERGVVLHHVVEEKDRILER